MTPTPFRSPQPTTAELGWAAIADELRAELRDRLADVLNGPAPTAKLARVAFVVTHDGVELTSRDELVATYRRHGLVDLARQIRRARTDRALVALVGDEVAILAVDARAWLDSLR